MNLEAAILYAHQRMREIGKMPDEYHFEPVLVYPTEDEEAAGKFKIKAYNEIYILLHPETHFGLFILADNSAYNSANALDCGVFEFTGVIHFLKTESDWSLTSAPSDGIHRVTANTAGAEFLRVVY